MDNSSNKTFFCNKGVVNSCSGGIEGRFETLIESKKQKPWGWYQALDIDKANASRIRRGLIIPPEWLRIKIASYFDVDSSVIWKTQEIVDFGNKKEVENGRL